MKLLTPSLLLAALILPATASAQPSARADSTAMQAQQRDLEKARRDLQQAREELRRAAREFANAAAALGRHSAMARALEFVADPDHAVLGVIVDSAPAAAHAGSGLRVLAVTPGSGADKAGLKAGDLLLALNGQPLGVDERVDLKAVLHEVMAQTRVGDAVQVEYERQGQKATATVVAGRAHPPSLAYAQPMPEADFVMPFRPPLHSVHAPLPLSAAPPPGEAHATDDLQLCKLNKELGAYFRASDGVLVVRAPRDGALGLRGGDVIQTIDGEPVNDPVTVMGRLFESEPKAVRLQVLRHGRPLLLAGQVPLSQALLHGENLTTAPPPSPSSPAPPVQ